MAELSPDAYTRRQIWRGAKIYCDLSLKQMSNDQLYEVREIFDIVSSFLSISKISNASDVDEKLSEIESEIHRRFEKVF